MPSSGNIQVDQMTLLTSPEGADVYAPKNDTDYRVRIGEANGLATLGLDSKLSSSQVPDINKTNVGLGNVDNTSDLNKPISTATQLALDSKLPLATYTASDILTKIKTVDGAGSGLDSDTVDGYQSGYLIDFTYATNKPTTVAGYGITDAVPLTGTGASGTWGISITGNAATATSASKWTTARSISLTGDVTGSTSVDGSANVSIAATVANNSHTHVASNISNSTTTGQALMTAASKAAGRQAIEIYVQSGTPSPSAAGALWIY